MFDSLPTTSDAVADWSWDQFRPYYVELLARPLSEATVDQWLSDWTALSALIDELNTRFTIATSVNTADEELERRYRCFLDELLPPQMEAEQQVKQKLLASTLDPDGFAMPLKKLRAEAELYREENLPLIAEHRKLMLDYDKLAGARTVTWDGVEIPLVQLAPVLEETDRDRREAAWRLARARVLADSSALADLWHQMITTRARLAANAGFPTYREYRWRQLFRFDYTPDDAKRFHAAIAEAVVPAATRLYGRRRRRLGVESLRPWDLQVDPSGRAPLRPYARLNELETKISSVFHAVDPRFGDYFETMRAQGLLDLESRKHKAPGGYSLAYTVTRQPFIFCNFSPAAGTHDDVQTLLHEGGHAFHSYEVAGLPYLQQRSEQMLPMEFAEVASMGMELLASPFLTAEHGGFYTPAQAARAAVDNLGGIITFWPYMAMIDTLQHWIYEHQGEAAAIEACDDYWQTLEERFRPALNWSGLELERRTIWRQQSHVFTDPFYYIEYGMAQLGAVQVWANSLRDHPAAVAAYRRALALGATAPLPTLFETAGAQFAFNAETLGAAVALIERTIAELEPVAAGAETEVGSSGDAEGVAGADDAAGAGRPQP
jgi:oligoendopeptidase F